MPVDFDILKEAGTTNERLRQFFTTRSTDEEDAVGEEKKRIKIDLQKLETVQDMIGSRMNEHIMFSLKNHHLYSSVDLAWDSAPINKSTIPLIMYAQKRINVSDCASELENLGCSHGYVKRDESGKIMDVDLPKFFETNINLVRSLITRRLAAQSNKYVNLWPFFKYESRTTGMAGKLRADVLSQRMDIMADQYNYRHFQTQAMRDMFLYGHCVAFPRAAWERDVQWEKEPAAIDFKPSNKTKIPKRSRVVKEGVCWVNPHPSRVFWDNAYPLTSLNSDTGCEYVGFWDVVRFGEISHNPTYFNRDKVGFSSASLNYFSQFSSYFNQYYTVINPPTPNSGDLSSHNDLKNNLGRYSGEEEDTSVMVGEFYWKMIPKEWGIGSYPFPLWVHLKVAGDDTVIFAEIMPSSPAAVFSYNESDSRLANISIAHELMSYQDQLTNLFSQMLETAKADLFSVGVLNTDVFPDSDEGKQVLADFRATMEGKNFYANTHVLEASFRRLQEMGVANPAEVFTIVRSSPSTGLQAIFAAITQLLNMSERLMALSPQEQGQPAPREISATEVNVISGTTESVYSFISDAIDEGRSVMKRICYESLISQGADTVLLPVVSRYPREAVEDAGFTIIDESQEEKMDVNRHTVMGSKYKLVHDYIFNSRDGSERTSNIQAANTLVALFQGIVAQPMISQAIGKRQLFELVNEIFRLSNTGTHLKLEMDGIEEGLMPEEGEAATDQIQANADAIGQLQQIISMLTGGGPGGPGGPGPGAPQGPAAPPPQAPPPQPQQPPQPQPTR